MSMNQRLAGSWMAIISLGCYALQGRNSVIIAPCLDADKGNLSTFRNPPPTISRPTPAMSACSRNPSILHVVSGLLRYGSGLWIALFVILLTVVSLAAQGVPTIQQSQFRSQWVGEQVDQIPLGGTITPLNSFGAVVGALQTPDEVQREVETSMAGVEQKSPFVFKPSLGVGWQISNQGLTNGPTTGNNGNPYRTGSSPFIAPSAAFLYDRMHGPWSVSAGYSVGYKYYSNQNFVANGTGSQRNPFSQTGLFKAILEMSRYVWNTLITASQGNGFNLSSGSNNQQFNGNANTEFKYLLSDQAAVATKAGYTIQNTSGATNTPNNNVSSYYAQVAPIYEVSDKTHLSAILGAGAQYQSFLNAQTSALGGTNGGTVTVNTTPQSTIQYVQALGKVKYDVTGKLVVEGSFGGRQLWLNNSTNISVSGNASGQSIARSGTVTSNQNLGLKPAWTIGFNYTPTAKTAVAFSMGQQGFDIVPELNLLLNWVPREKTAVSIGVSQSQNYSNIAASQYLIQRGIVGTLNQNLFSNISVILSGGYTKQFYQNITGGQTPTSGAAAQIPGSYYLATASVVWKIRDWVNLNNTVYYNSGQTIQAGGNNSALSQTWYAVSLNFSL
jgi:hypothetical protein